MAQQRLIMAIGRIERALSRLEQARIPQAAETESNPELQAKYDRLKAETQAAIREIDQLLAGSDS